MPAQPLVLIFDGDCGICTAFANWATRAGEGRIRSVSSLDDAALPAYGVSAAAARQSAWAVDAHGRRFDGAAAINRTLLECAGAWPTIAALYRRPVVRFAQDRGYRWVARHRARLSALLGRPACRLPSG
jgi:predicted DCC family thiol-disulfide oxidoreductase YuxK